MFYGRRFCLAIAILFMFVAHAAFGSGRAEDPIRQARELVSENRINEAILLLEQTVRDDPDRILEAEALLRTIREIRGEYNVLFEQLIDNLVNNPDDIERTLEIIDQMEQLDSYPNERVVQQVRDARIVAQLAYDRSIVDRVMEEARLLVADAQYTAAIARYLSLRDLQRDRFEERGYGDIFLDSVNRAVAQLDMVSRRFSDLFPSYQTAGAQVLAVAERDVLDITPEHLLVFFEEAEAMVGVVAQIHEISNTIAVLKSQVPLQFPDEPVDWYLNFQDIIARGRTEQRGNEGVLHTIETAYRTTISDLTVAASTQTNGLFERGLDAADDDLYDRAAELFTTGVQTAQLWERAESASMGLFFTDSTAEEIVDSLSEDNARSIFAARIARRAMESLLGLSAPMSALVAASGDSTGTLDSLESQKSTVEELYATLLLGSRDWDEQRDVIVSTPAAYRREEDQLVIREVDERWDGAITRTVVTEADLAVSISLVLTDGAEISLSEIGDLLDEAEPLIEGIVAETEDTAGEDDQEVLARIVRYPDSALESFRRAAARLTTEIERIDDSNARLAADSDYIQETESVTGEYARLERLRRRVSLVLDRTGEGIAEAERLIEESETFVEQARRRIADARAALSQLQVTAARNNWDAAREAFVSAFDLREDATARAQADALIQEVGLQIQEAENILVVRRVRELLTSANELYAQDEYVAARDTLLEAQQTWEQTNVDTNTEIERLLQLVTAALSLEEGRELTITDPLYPVLGNYLSIAREDYNRGVRLYESGATERADALFDRAIENLQNVRAVRPLNWEARILELRIAQIRNSEDFDQVFAARYQQAVSRVREAGALQVYGELEVLAEINPDYPGLQDQLRQLEITLNLRPDPVGQAQVAEAAQLYARAQTLAAGGSQDAVAVAVTLLEQAIELNPSNGSAAFLLDQLRIQLGGQATVALSTADELQYRRAETLFSQGRVLQALSITERLLENVDNRSYPPLVELRRRIGLRLGI